MENPLVSFLLLSMVMWLKGSPLLIFAVLAGFTTATARPAPARADFLTQEPAIPAQDRQGIEDDWNNLTLSLRRLDGLDQVVQGACDGVRHYLVKYFFDTQVRSAFDRWQRSAQSPDSSYPFTFYSIQGVMSFARSKDGRNVVFQLHDPKSTSRTLTLKTIVYQVGDSRATRRKFKDLYPSLSKIQCSNFPTGIDPAEYRQVVPDFEGDDTTRRQLIGELKAISAAFKEESAAPGPGVTNRKGKKTTDSFSRNQNGPDKPDKPDEPDENDGKARRSSENPAGVLNGN